ncbi:MAG TPA: Gfo/Idh/MocA family oxidoreductase [Halanaerobiales bacterium]|nr:Gfo/Idh/MocA family oxidoreductase [Halanaerobiales bacterium]
MTINWGIIGTGVIANTFANEFNYVKEGKLLAVASRSKENAQKFADANNIERAYQGYENLVNDEDLDVIYIATPHSLHYEHTMLCLENNKSVLCEKPLAVNENQENKMFAKAKDKNLFLMEAMWTYFLPPIQKAKEWINTGKIGEIQVLTAQVGIIPRPPRNDKGRLFNPYLAGGALLDTGIYPIALANLLLPDDHIDLKITSQLADSGVDEHDSIILKYKNNAIAQLTCTIQAQIKTDAYIYGTKGTIHLPYFLRTDKAILENEDGRETYEDLRTSLGYNYEIDAVNKCLQNNKKISNIMPPAKSIKNIRVIDKAREKIGLKYPFERN